MADPVNVARGVVGGARATTRVLNFADEYAQLMEIFRRSPNPNQQALAREAAERLYNQSLQGFQLKVPVARGQVRTFDISPNAPNLVVKMPSGSVIEIPRGANIPQGAQVLNKSAEELRAMIPQEIRPPAPSATTSVPSAGARPIQPEAPAAAAPSTAPWGRRPAAPSREADLGLPLGVAGLAGTGAILASQRSDIYGGGKGEAPMPQGGNYDDSFNAPYTPPLTKLYDEFGQGAPQYPQQPPAPEPRDLYAETNQRAPNYLGSVGRAGALPIMARPDGGRGDGVEPRPQIDPSILMLARERLMPYSARGIEGRPPAEPSAGGAGGGGGGAPARTTQAAPAAPAAQSGSFFSGLFKDPYEGQSSRQLYETYQKRGDEDPAMFVRAARKEMEERKAAGLARGGSAGSEKHGKDAAVMKALEIIHHMLQNR